MATTSATDAGSKKSGAQKSSERRVVLCAVQDAPQSFDLAESLDRLEALTADAVDQAWDAAAAKWPGEVEFEMIVVFPEGFLSSYPRGLDFGSPIGSRSKEGREWYRRYFDSSVPVSDTNGAVMQRIRGVAKKNEVTLVVGVIERCNCEVTAGVGEPARETWAAKEKGGHGSLYCTSLMIGTEGEIISSRRKLQPTGLERLVWGQGSASDISVAVKDTAVGRVGSAICWENYMPLFRYTLYEKGTQIWCAPTADARDQWAGTMTHVALEGRCFVVSCCQYAERKDYPDDHPAYKGTPPDHVITRGGSMIVSPLGTVLAGPLYDKRGILTVCIDDVQAEITEAQMDLDTCGHYGRPDLFSLRVTGDA